MVKFKKGRFYKDIRQKSKVIFVTSEPEYGKTEIRMCIQYLDLRLSPISDTVEKLIVKTEDVDNWRQIRCD